MKHTVYSYNYYELITSNYLKVINITSCVIKYNAMRYIKYDV